MTFLFLITLVVGGIFALIIHRNLLFNIKQGYETQAEESSESVDALFDMDFSALLGA